ncbi:MAG TPA: Holliday junction resolvase RuvX [Candidatus Acidoferrum sp.]|nr:Holliday junction resolvase RuvX [Candidatus Acidoferrum sp.]
MTTASLNTNASKPARILALDYGRARIGLAVADPGAAQASHLATMDRINRNEDMRRLREVVREHGVKQIVVGLPLRLDGTRGDMAEEAARFGQRVHKQLGLPVEMVDERLTSWEAERLLEEQQGRTIHTTSSKHSSKQRQKQSSRPDVDAMAAALILNEYLDRLHAAPSAQAQQEAKKAAQASK